MTALCDERNRYETRITDRELHRWGQMIAGRSSAWRARLIMESLKADLLFRSGASNVASARLLIFRQENQYATTLRVSFDSRAWTGRR